MRCVNSLSSIRTRKALACAIVIDPCMSGRRRGVRPIGGLVVTAQLRAQQQQQQQQCPPSERSAPQLQRPLRQLNNALPKARKAPQSPVSQLQATNLDTTPRGGLLAPAPAVNAAANAEQPSEAQLAKTGTARGSVIGAVALITGSTVGAGILALPAVSAPAGFLPSAATMVACWALLAAEALLLADVNLAVRAQKEKATLADGEDRKGSGMVTLHQMAEATLGQAGASATSAVYLGLSYSLLVAYIAKAASVISDGTGGALDGESAALLFTGAMGGMLWVGGAQAAEVVNGGLTVALLLLFAAIVVMGGSQADFGSLQNVVDWSAAPATLPIIFLSLVYHDLVPVICDMLGGDRRRITVALMGGSLLPLAMFLSWTAVTLAVMPATGLAGAEGSGSLLDPLVVLMQHGDSAIGPAIGAFSLLAIATSFIGTTLGLSSTITEELKSMASRLTPPRWLFPQQQQQQGEDGILGRSAVGAGGEEAGSASRAARQLGEQAVVYLLVLAPPLHVASSNPEAFFGMLNAAGAYGMTLLYGVAPPLMASRLRCGSAAAPPETASESSSLLGMQPVLAALCASATGVALSQAWADAGHPSGDSLMRGLHHGFATAAGSVAEGLSGLPAGAMAAVSETVLCAWSAVAGMVVEQAC